ncbi:MAG TPA: dihydrofolate reductase family protein [Solirubrobacterales bacterium]|nr:dihydrofolate reductase family protein [Solirubrobacterales bacterium]
MSRLRFQISISLDGFVAGPNQSRENPLGEGGEALHDWVVKLEAWRKSHGREGGEINASSTVFEEAQENFGAGIMGRKMFGGGPGPWDEKSPWQGWWGEDPPFHAPVFVLTHHERDPLRLSDTTFYFVTDGIESALEQARAAAAGKDVWIGGGAEAIQQYLAAGLVDEMLLNVVPIMLGGGERLFDNLGGADLGLEQAGTIAGPEAMHLKYRLAS